MKKYLSIVFDAIFVMSLLTGCAGQIDTSYASVPMSTLGQGDISDIPDIPDISFRDEEYQKLLALQFDGYEDMTVSDYRSRIAERTDTAEYKDLLERFSQNESLYELRDTNEIAAFLFYVLEPLTAEKWQSRTYSGSASSDFPYPEDNAMVEYVFTLTILDADALTVREYTTTRFSVITVCKT